METKKYASADEQKADLLYNRLSELVLIKDKEGRPLKWKKVKPPMTQLIESCKKEGIDLPKNPKLSDVLLAMVKGGYTDVQRNVSPPKAIKSLTQRAFEREAGIDTISAQEEAPPVPEEIPPGQEETPPEGATEAEINAIAFEQLKIKAIQEEKGAALAQKQKDLAKLDAELTERAGELAKKDAEQAEKLAEQDKKAAEQAEKLAEQDKKADKQAEKDHEKDELRE